VSTNGKPYQIYPCPEGTYLNLQSKDSESDCIKCPPGLACETKGISDDLTDAAVIAAALLLSPPVDYKCAAGFFCLLGSKTRYPYDSTGSAGNWGPCPPGKYCP